MTPEEIEKTIIQAHADMLAAFLRTGATEPECDRALTRTLRAMFTAGQDNGHAIIFNRLENSDWFADSMKTLESDSLARSMAIINRWLVADGARHPLRSYSSGPTMLDGDSRRWRVTCYYQITQRHFYGAHQGDALAQFATWAEAEMLPDHDGKTEPNNEKPECQA